MDTGGLVLIVSVIVIVLLFSLLRGRGGSVRNRPEVIQFLLFDVKINQALVETYHQREKFKRFERTNWELNKSKISFLSDSLQETLKMTFSMVEDINAELKIIKKDKSRSFKEINVSQLEEPLAKCREGLEGWLIDAIGTTEVPIRYPSLTGFLFGDR